MQLKVTKMKKKKNKKRGNKDEEGKKNLGWVRLRFTQPHGSENRMGVMVGHSLVFLHHFFSLA
jgi:hypothetical protein